jgi:hypothetical protein
MFKIHQKGYHLTVIRMAVIKILKMTNAGEDVETKESLHTVGRNVYLSDFLLL